MTEKTMTLQELGASMAFTDHMLRQMRDGRLAQRIRDMAMQRFVDKMIVGGTTVVKVDACDTERNVMERSSQVYWNVNVLDDEHAAAIAAKVGHQRDQLYAVIYEVNLIPWWRLLWLKLRRRPIVEAV